MKFERGKDVKEALNVGLRDALRVHSVSFAVKDPDIRDDRPYASRHLSPSPQTVLRDRIYGAEVHKILALLRDNRKFPWDYFFKKYPELKDMIVKKEYRFSFFILLEPPEGMPRGKYPAVPLVQIVEKHLIYENQIYYMKKNRP